jgi:hypothetical protein
MSISKKLFVLLILAMILSTIAILTLVMTGHEALVRDAFRWLSSSTEAIAGTLLSATVFILFLVFLVLL